MAKLNIAEVAPMPIASEQIATAVKTGSLRKTRKAWVREGSMWTSSHSSDSRNRDVYDNNIRL
jgi:hypothetical protein